MKVSVIIPTTIGGFNYLARLIPNLSQEVKKNDGEIIIVDNASKDGSLNYLSNYDCKIIVNLTNHNFSQANNQAAKIAEGEYLLFLNNDTTVTPDFIREMLSAFDHESVGIVGCLLLRASDSKVQHAGVYFTHDNIPYELGLETPGFSPAIPRNDNRVNSVHEVPAVSAACMMIDKEIFLRVGGFDETYINGWEDTDLCLKVRELGFNIWYTGKAIVYHVHHGSVNRGRFAFENQNRLRYESIWLKDDRINNILKNYYVRNQ